MAVGNQFYGSFLNEFGWSRTQVSSIYSVFMIGIGIVSTSYILLASVQGLWQFYLIVSLGFGTGMSCMGGMAWHRSVIFWFDHWRGRAIAFAVMGASLAGIMMPPLVTSLVDAYGWRTGYYLFAVSTALTLLAVVAVACARSRGVGPDTPEAVRSDHRDEYFGVGVPDPYRWLEELESTATAGFVAEQNALAQPYLEAIPARRRLVERMTRLWDYERYGLPQKRGGRYFFEYNDGSQGQDVLMVADAVDGEPRVLIDPNSLRDDATISLADFEASPDGAHVAWGVSDGGTDFKIWRIRNVDTGDDLEDELRHMKFSRVSWGPDSSGFYYSRYPTRTDGESDDSKQVSVFHHRLGTPQSEDRHVYSIEEGDGDPDACPHPR